MWYLAGIVVIGALLYIALELAPSRRRRRRFLQREPLSADMIFDQFFKDRGWAKAAVLELWDEIASAAEVPSGRMRPSDSFHRELAAEEGWEFSGETLSITLIAERRAKLNGRDVDLARIHTVEDYIKAFLDTPTTGDVAAKRS